MANIIGNNIKILRDNMGFSQSTCIQQEDCRDSVRKLRTVPCILSDRSDFHPYTYG